METLVDSYSKPTHGAVLEIQTKRVKPGRLLNISVRYRVITYLIEKLCRTVKCQALDTNI
jgi:hypothetical protein